MQIQKCQVSLTDDFVWILISNRSITKLEDQQLVSAKKIKGSVWIEQLVTNLNPGALQFQLVVGTSLAMELEPDSQDSVDGQDGEARQVFHN